MEEAKELRKEGDFKTAMQQAQQARAEMFQREELDKRLSADFQKLNMQLSVMMRGQDIDAKTAAARADQSGALGAVDIMRNKLGVLEDRIKAARGVITEYQKARGIGMPETPQDRAAYNKAVETLNSDESMRNQLAGLSSSSGSVASAGGAGVIDFNTLR